MKKNYICPEIEAILFEESIMGETSVIDGPGGGDGTGNGTGDDDYAKKNNLGFSFFNNYDDEEDEEF